MKKYYFILALILLSLTACKKDKHINGPTTPSQPQLPPITTEGKNTFGCLVNGEVWLPEVKPYQMSIYPLTSSYDNVAFKVTAKKKIHDNIYQSISFQIIALADTGNYYLDSNSSVGSAGVYTNVLISCSYFTDTTQVGVVKILKFDIPNKIISGTFEMTLYKSWNNTDCDTIKITEGRFDVKFAQ
jgi:hypothetical protein